MDTLSRDELRALAADQGGHCVSLYLPTHRSGAETQQNPIRLRNLLDLAEARLVARDLRSTEAKAFLAPAEKLVADSDFWRRQGDGLAMFIGADGLRAFRLPVAFQELAVVGDRMHVKPLLALFSGTGRFYNLALSQNNVRLLQATAHHVGEADLDGAPRSLAEAMKYDEVEKSHQMHTKGSFGTSGAGQLIGHGHEVDDKDRIKRFFQQVNHGLHAGLRDEQAPLVLAAVEYLMPIYREANTYAQVLDEGIVGNPDDLSADELARRGREIVAPRFHQAQADAVARYQQLAGTGGTASSVSEVVRAAVEGRVDVLLVAEDKQLWGSFDAETMAVELTDGSGVGDQDLLDLAVVETLLKGGSVYVVPAEEIPADSAVVGVLRY
jgi:hypothetical protein